MLICNNCHAVNSDGVERCIQCHMAGNFTHQDDEGKTGDPLHINHGIITCLNCGSETSAQAKKCQQCHFPVSLTEKGKAESNTPRGYGLRVG